MGMTPKIILLDEPTASLDIGSKRELLKMLDLLKNHIRTTIVATHDMQLVADWASRVVVLSAGRVIFDGIARDLFKEKEIMEKANLIVPQVVDLSLHMGLEVDVAEGGHVILINTRRAILAIRQGLDPYTKSRILSLLMRCSI